MRRKIIDAWEEEKTFINTDITYNELFFLNTSPTLLYLSIWFNRIGVLSISSFARNRTLIYLDLSFDRINDQGVVALADNVSLAELELSNQIKNSGAMALAKNMTLSRLILSHNRMGEQGTKALARNITLTYMNLICSSHNDEMMSEHIMGTMNPIRSRLTRIQSEYVRELYDTFPTDILRFIFIPYLLSPHIEIQF